MKRLFLIILVVLLWATVAYGGMTQYTISGANDALNPSEEFNIIMGGNSSWAITESNVSQIIPVDTTVRGLSVTLLSVANGTVTFKIYKNGVDTGYSAVVSTGNTTGIWSGSLSVSAGDKLSVSATDTAGIEIASWSLYFDHTDNQSGFVTIVSGGHTNGTKYLPLVGSSAWQTTESASYGVNINKPVVFKKLYVELSDAPTGTEYRTITLRKGVADSGFAVTISGSNVSGNSGTLTEAVVSGAYIDWKQTDSGAAAAVSWIKIGAVIDTGTNGESVVVGGTANDILVSGTEYNYLNGGGNWSGTESLRPSSIGWDTTFKNLFVKSAGAPTSTYSYVTAVRDDTADSDLGVTITGTDTSGEDTGSVVISAYSLLGMKYTSNGGAQNDIFWSLTQYNEPPSSSAPVVTFVPTVTVY